MQTPFKAHTAFAIFSFALLLGSGAQAAEQQQRRGPPEEAFSACANQSEGASCVFSTPRGELSGSCMTGRGAESTLVCAPAGGQGMRKKSH